MPAYRFFVPLHETDAAGVLFFAHLFRHAHDAYEAFMAELGLPLPELIADGVRLPLTHAEADYLRPIHHGDSIIVETGVSEVGRSSFALAYLFRDPEGHVCAEASTVHVYVDPKDGRSAPLPNTLREALEDAAELD